MPRKGNGFKSICRWSRNRTLSNLAMDARSAEAPKRRSRGQLATGRRLSTSTSLVLTAHSKRCLGGHSVQSRPSFAEMNMTMYIYIYIYTVCVCFSLVLKGIYYYWTHVQTCSHVFLGCRIVPIHGNWCLAFVFPEGPTLV